MKYCLIILYLLPLSIAAQLPEGFIREAIAFDLDPTSMTIAPDGRIFITQKLGIVSIVRNDIILEDPFLDIPVDNANERGLGNIALDPDFEHNGYVYLFYTIPGLNQNRVSRFTANGDYAIPGSEEILLETDMLFTNIHNGGAIIVGKDNKLYIATGESGLSYKAPNMQSLLGKVLRLNLDGSIPEDNPYYEELDGDNKSIWAYGLRNPFSMAINPLDGAIYANDVGNTQYEEINKIEKGAFYGWDKLEGYQTNEELPVNYFDPVYAYHHNNGCAIVGSHVYAPEIQQFPDEYRGKYFFADYCRGQIRILNLESGDVEGVFMTGGNRIVDIDVDENGDMYYLERRGLADGSPEDNTSTSEGILWRIRYTGSGAPHVSRHPSSMLRTVGESATFSIEASGSAPLTFAWEVNGIPFSDADSSSFIIPTLELTDNGSEIRCLISNAHGSVYSNTAIVNVTSNQRPVVSILHPSGLEKYRAGESILFDFSVNDPEQGELPDSTVSWWVDFHHLDHTHPALSLRTGTGGNFVIPASGEIDTNVWYRFYAKAIDEEGLQKTEWIDIFPRTYNIPLSTNPGGLEILVDGKREVAPFTLWSVEGMERTLQSPRIQYRNDTAFFFERWKDLGDDPIITFNAKSPITGIQGEYSAVPVGHGSGLSVFFHNNRDLAEEPAAVRTDSVVNFVWFLQQPHPNVDNDNFSARWEGYVLPYRSGFYHFYTIVNDGVRLFIDNELVIDRWAETSTALLDGASYFMEEGRLYPIRFEMFDGGWWATAILQWAHEDFETQVVSQSQLYPSEFLSEKVTNSDIAIDLIAVGTSENGYVSIESKIRKQLQFSWHDMAGKKILDMQHQLNFGLNNINLPRAQLPAGIYILQIQDQESLLHSGRILIH